jgi:hypothetical protein
MSQQVEAILVEGMVDALTFQFVANPPHVVVELDGVSKKIAIIGAPYIHVSDRIRAVCLAEPNREGLHEAVDFIHNEHKRPITDEQRAEQARRVGLVPIYETPSSLTIQPVISKITEIGLELIAHLKRHPELLRGMHSDAFEKLIAELMASGGFDVEWTGRNGKTGGDVIAFKLDSGLGLVNNYIVECKRYGPDNPVGIEIARTIYGAKAAEGYSNALLVTTSTVQSGVEQFAMQHWDFQFKDYKALVEWLNLYRPKEDGRLHMEDRRLVIEDYKPARRTPHRKN